MDENIVAQSKRWVVRQVISDELKVNSKETIGIGHCNAKKKWNNKVESLPESSWMQNSDSQDFARQTIVESI